MLGSKNVIGSIARTLVGLPKTLKKNFETKIKILTSAIWNPKLPSIPPILLGSKNVIGSIARTLGGLPRTLKKNFKNQQKKIS